MQRRDCGFTLVETVVALVIFAISLAGLQHALGSGWKAMRLARSESAAVEHARALLALSSVARPMQPGITTGTLADGSRWEIEITEAHPPRVALTPRSQYSGYWIAATVSRRNGAEIAATRSVTLQTFVIAGGQL